MLHITCNMCTRDLPDMYALSPRACGPRAYISGKSLVPMLQLLRMHWLHNTIHMYVVDAIATYTHLYRRTR